MKYKVSKIPACPAGRKYQNGISRPKHFLILQCAFDICSLMFAFFLILWNPGFCFGQAEAGQDSVESAVKAVGQNKISLDIKGMDIVDVLKMLSTRSGMNIVVGKNVTGRVTLFLKDVDTWDAFEIILSANDLAYEKKGGIINVMTQRDYEQIYGARYQDKKEVKVIQLKYAKAVSLSAALNQIKTNVGRVVADEGSNTVVLIDSSDKINEMMDFIKKTDLPIETRIFGLNYAQADKLNTKIQENLTKNVGYISIDERTNKIAVTDYPAKLNEIAKVVSAFDEKTPQVLIDAQVVEIKPTDKFEMGVDWDFWLEKNVRLATSIPATSTINKLSIGMAASGQSPSGAKEYKGILDLLRTIGDTKILSSPRIMAINNQEAKILVGTKDAYITSSTSQTGETAVTSQSVNFVDVGIKLYVTPTINRDGFVTMKIKPEVSSSERKKLISEGKETEVPIVTTSETETTVMVKDGITIIIGGLKKDEKYKTEKRIPLLGDIPLAGVLFRSLSDESKRTELVILLTPHIISGASPYTDFSAIKPVEGAVLKMDKGEIVSEKISESARNNVNPPWDPIAAYYVLVNRKIEDSVKNSEPGDKKGRVSLSFVLSPQGLLLGEPAVVAVTERALASFAVKAVKDASPFPIFPKELDKKAENFLITVDYN